MPLPEALINAPQLELGLELHYNAFTDLNSCRSIGFAEGPIPWLSVHAYAAALGITGVQREDLLYHVQHLDTVYLEFRAKQAKKGAADGRTKTVRKAGSKARR